MSENILSVFWNYRWLIMGTAVLFLSASLIYLKETVPLYSSTSRIYIEQNGPRILDEKDEKIKSNYLYIQVEFIGSTLILKEVLEICKENKSSGVAGRLSGMDNPLGYLKRNLKVTVGKKNDIIDVSFFSPYPKEAAIIANAVVDSYINYNAYRERNTSSEILRILQSEKDKRSNDLTEKLKAMAEYEKIHTKLIFGSKKGNLVIERLASLSDAMTRAQLETTEAKATHDSTKAMVENPIILKQFVDAKRSELLYLTPDDSTILKTKLNQHERQLDDLLRTLTMDHPAVLGVEKRISKVKEQIRDLDREFARAQLAFTEQKYAIAQQKEKQIQQHFEEQRQLALELNAQYAQYALLESDLDQTKKLCDILDERIKEIDITDDSGRLNISVLEIASAGSHPVKPQKVSFIAMSLIAGVILSCGASLVCDLMDSRLRGDADVARTLGVPVLGVVPTMKERKDVSYCGRKSYLDLDSCVAEAYRKIRTSVLYGVPKDMGKTLLVTSSESGDGKSTTASNLAITMAQAGQKTLLIDADLRKPRLNAIFGIETQNGLSGVITGKTSLPRAINPTVVSGLNLMCAGCEVPNPSELLNSDSFLRILRILACQYDRIIIDSSPLLCVADSLILSAICDFTILIVNARKSTKETCMQAHKELVNVSANVLGVVVNDVSARGGKYSYYRAHGYKNDRRKNNRRKNNDCEFSKNRRKNKKRRVNPERSRVKC